MIELLVTENTFRSEFEKIYTENIKRDGANKLLEYLKTTDFFESPASTKFHGNFAGGLCEHSVKVWKRFSKMLECEYGADWIKKPENNESAAVVSLLHDICKVNCYKNEMRNVKVGSEWVQKPYFSYDDPMPYGHGEKSVYMISGYMKLSREEAMCINWHMGGFDSRNSDGRFTVSSAFKLYPLAAIFHAADFLATYLDEKVIK
jgi:hypothetical protein